MGMIFRLFQNFNANTSNGSVFDKASLCPSPTQNLKAAHEEKTGSFSTAGNFSAMNHRCARLQKVTQTPPFPAYNLEKRKDTSKTTTNSAETVTYISFLHSCWLFSFAFL